MQAADIAGDIRPRLAGALVATDFDGTLAPLVPDPERSAPVPGAIEALRALADAGAQVAVITGRDARTVLRVGDGLGDIPGLVVAGLYGIEVWHAGSLETPEEPAGMTAVRERLPAVLREARADPAIWIEDKRLSLVVHARRATDPDAALDQVRTAVGELAGEVGVEVHPGRDVLELRVPGFDKGGALRRLAEGRDTVLFLGDDLGDLPAFGAVRELRREGRTAYGIGVLSSGVVEVADAADVTVPDADAAVALLGSLVE